MSKLNFLNSFLNKAGYELKHYRLESNDLLRRYSIFKKYNIGLLIDVGANTGIYGKEIRKLGYKGLIVSFEPLNDAFLKLESIAKKDKNWLTYNCALGFEEADEEINISINSHSSSILNILETHTEAEKSASYIGKQKIKIIPFDSIFPKFKDDSPEIFLKIDTQGYELQVLNGAYNSLEYINTIQVEMSLKALYANQVVFNEMIVFLWEKGYELISIEPGFVDPRNGTLLQVDGIFRKKEFV